MTSICRASNADVSFNEMRPDLGFDLEDEDDASWETSRGRKDLDQFLASTGLVGQDDDESEPPDDGDDE